ncbi:alpha/beta fold hydrolase [Sphingomonas sp. BK580]|uniref:alpha/beta fold hydrolase n=1 Tax=Sphingomonas sp. BK580 TaxID=2586972 RepID=UPI0021A6E774|nr:alpha/beta hydrolase [Sphingomonas sp. BK580]
MIDTPLGQVAVDEQGSRSGRTVLIVPGTAGWSGFWRNVTAHLVARGYHVVAVDLPPFGYSEHDARARYDRRSQAARLRAVLAATSPMPAIVVAHSFGAGPATELALVDPKRVARLVLIDGALGELDPAGPGGNALLRLPFIAQPLVAATLTNPHAIGALSRSMLARKEAAAEWRETLRAPMRRPGTTAAYAAWLPSLLAADDGAPSRRTEALLGLKPAVRLIWGEADTVTPISQGLALARLLRAPITRLPGVGHVPHIEDPTHFLPALDAALEEPTQ